jgi:SAM-dependent methyltransferase
MSLEPEPGNPAYWLGLYDRGSDRWELGRPTPSLAAQLGRRPPPVGTVAVPGCGRGHDARLLARQGYRVIGFDFVPVVLRVAHELAVAEGVDVIFEDLDVFALARSHPRFFDGIWTPTMRSHGVAAESAGRRHVRTSADVLAGLGRHELGSELTSRSRHAIRPRRCLPARS